MFTHDTQVYANLRIPMHDYSDLRILRNEYAMITQWLRTDNAMIMHLVLSFAHCYALIRMLRNVTQNYAGLRMIRKHYAWITQALRINYAMDHQYSLSDHYALIAQRLHRIA